MAKYACPFVKQNCGDKNTIDLNNTGETQNIQLNINPGQTCFYQINANCGFPAFKLNDTTGLDVEVIDYTDKDL